MAGKKNGKPTIGSKKNARPQNLAANKFLIPCNGGKNAYVYDAETSRNPNLVVGSDRFREAIAANVAAGVGAKIREELGSLAARFPEQGWAAVLADLESDGTLPA